MGPGLLAILAMYGAFRFRLSQPRHQILINELERLRAGGHPQDASPQTRETIELLTGHPHRNARWQHAVLPQGSDYVAEKQPS